MKVHLINTHLLIPRSRSSAKVKVKYQGHVSHKMGVSGAFVFHKGISFFLSFYLFCKTIFFFCLGKQGEGYARMSLSVCCLGNVYKLLLILCSELLQFYCCCVETLMMYCSYTVKPVLETTCIKRPPALRDHYSDTTTLLNPFPHTDTFGRPWETSLLKTLWEKRNCS